MHVRIEDADRTAFSEQPLDQLDKGTFAHVVGSGFETDSEKGDASRGRIEYPLQAALDQYAIAFEDMVENRQRQVSRAGEIGEGAQILWEARAAKREARAQVSRRNVEALVLEENVHDV